MTVRGSVDVLTQTEVTGWAFSPGRNDPVLVQAVLNHEILGEATAGLHRADLAAAGLGDGNAGYVIKLFRPIDPMYFPFVVVKVDGGDAELPRAPVLGFAEFFGSLHSAYPAAGRHRSVFGGLWTDRTDARALLRGKGAVGQVGPDILSPLAQLVEDGYAVIALQAYTTSTRPAKLAADIPALLEDGALLPVLHAVLEDNPVGLLLAAAPGKAFTQPSGESESGSPAECLLVVAVAYGTVRLDVVRDSHRLPEFTRTGLSRWAQRVGTEPAILADGARMLDTVEMVTGTAVLIGPGTLYRLRYTDEASVLQVLCLPNRAVPVSLARQVRWSEMVRDSGIRFWIS